MSADFVGFKREKEGSGNSWEEVTVSGDKERNVRNPTYTVDMRCDSAKPEKYSLK